MTMIEQMAEASHEFFRARFNLPPFAELPPDARSTVFQHMRAILDKMDMPTREMVTAAFPFAGPGWRDAVPDLWRAMLDAAKAEKPA